MLRKAKGCPVTIETFLGLTRVRWRELGRTEKYKGLRCESSGLQCANQRGLHAVLRTNKMFREIVKCPVDMSAVCTQ